LYLSQPDNNHKRLITFLSGWLFNLLSHRVTFLILIQMSEHYIFQCTEPLLKEEEINYICYIGTKSQQKDLVAFGIQYNTLSLYAQVLKGCRICGMLLELLQALC